MISPPLDNWRALSACFARELQVSLLNRFVHVFSVAALLAGVVPLFADQARGDAAPYFLLQTLLYLVPLFALLAGTGSAQSDQDEHPFLLTQPVRRGVLVLGKFLALVLVLALALLLVVLPSALADTALKPLAFLWSCGVGIGSVFAALGLACGFAIHDRVKAHLVSSCVWLLFLAGFDLLAVVSAHFSFVQGRPGLWAAILMVNPLDALRIGALFTIDKVPFDATQATPLVQWWLDHVGLWFALLVGAWTTVALIFSARRLERSSF
jgi:ABC-type transport system involved in multi-copper enzyme maturation permease subunit